MSVNGYELTRPGHWMTLTRVKNISEADWIRVRNYIESKTVFWLATIAYHWQKQGYNLLLARAVEGESAGSRRYVAVWWFDGNPASIDGCAIPYCACDEHALARLGMIEREQTVLNYYGIDEGHYIKIWQRWVREEEYDAYIRGYTVSTTLA